MKMGYPKYQRSQVEWLGQIPEHWGVSRLRFLCKVGTGDKDAINAVENGSYPFFVRSQTIERIDTYSFDGEAVFTAGDGVGVGKVFHYHVGRCDFHQRVYKFSDFKKISGRFFFYYLRELFNRVALEGGAKSTVDSLRLPLIKNFVFTIPTPSEQKIICDYLDYKTFQIDTLIAKKNEFIDRLKEKRTALISQIVTKGLPPEEAKKHNMPQKPELKPSGIEWLGDIPANWNVDRLRRRCKRVTDGAHISPDLSSDDFPFVSTVDISKSGKIDFENCLKTSAESYEYLARNNCRPFLGDVLFSKDGTIGRTSCIDFDSQFVVASSLIIISPNPHSLNSKYLEFWLNNSLLQQNVLLQIAGAAIPRVSIEKVGRLPVLLPPLEEQRLIVNYLNRELANLDSLVANVEKAIELLAEYRTTTITNAVTGKIDVRDFKKSLKEQ